MGDFSLKKKKKHQITFGVFVFQSTLCIIIMYHIFPIIFSFCVYISQIVTILFQNLSHHHYVLYTHKHRNIYTHTHMVGKTYICLHTIMYLQPCPNNLSCFGCSLILDCHSSTQAGQHDPAPIFNFIFFLYFHLLSSFFPLLIHSCPLPHQESLGSHLFPIHVQTQEFHFFF